MINPILVVVLGAIAVLWVMRYVWLMLTTTGKPKQGKPSTWGKQSDSIAFTGKRFSGR